MKGRGTSTEPFFAVLDPRTEEPEREIHGLNPRPGTLEGKTVNVINLHGGNEEAFASISTDLKEAIPGCNTVYFRTDGGFGGGPFTEEDWKKMLDCDAAITGHNYWGGAVVQHSGVAAEMEKRGIPVVSEIFNLDDLVALAEREFMKRGVPKVRQVLTTPDTSLKSLKEFVPGLIDALTRPLTAEEKWAGTYKPPERPRIAMTGTYDEVQEFFLGDLTLFAGRRAPVSVMTDGLPVTPPTEERVARMLKGTSHAPDEVVKPKIKPDQFFVPQEELIGATVEKIAINGVMAGCRPEHMPVLLAMAELGGCVGCPCDCDFSHMFVVSGPIAKEIGMNAGFHALGPGNPANSSIARACTLIGINLGGVEFGANVIERIGAFIWGLTFAESEDTPWDGLNINEGYNTDESVLVSFGGPVKVNGACLNEVKEATNLSKLQYGSPEQLVAAFKASRETRSALVIFTPDTANQWKREYGFKTMQQLQDYLYDNATWTRGEWGRQYFFYMKSMSAKQNPRGSRMINPDHLELPEDALVPIIVNGAREIKVIVTGGNGFQWGYGNAWGTSSTLIDRWR